MGKHYIAMAGLHGYMPMVSEVTATRGQAAELLGGIHELSKNKIKQLRRDYYLELDLSIHGNEYCEIIECDCNEEEMHSDTLEGYLS